MPRWAVSTGLVLIVLFLAVAAFVEHRAPNMDCAGPNAVECLENRGE